MIWLLEESVLNAMENAHPLSDAQIDSANAAIGREGANAERVLVTSGTSATINITGVMTSAPSFMAFYFGGGNTLYGDLHAAIDAVESDDKIKSVEFVINSGGGEAQPAIDLGDKIAAMRKTTTALVRTAASAAYWAASQADKIVACSRSSRVGSIGAVKGAYKPSEMYYVEVTSTNAPDKRPNPETVEGQATIKAELDQFHDLFATAVAIGRNKSVETVNSDFGRGGTMLAEQALAAGMIDAIGAKTKTSTIKTGATMMDLATLKLKHPELLAQIQSDAHAGGVIAGENAEKDRVKFHGLMGKKTGATAFALEACLNGTSMSDVEANVEYATFGRDAADLKDRSVDEQQLKDNVPALAEIDAREEVAAKTIFERAGVTA